MGGRRVPSTPAEDLALAILLWRYVGHRVQSRKYGLIKVVDASLARAERALRMAKRAGVRDEYLRLMMAVPLLSVTVANLGD